MPASPSSSYPRLPRVSRRCQHQRRTNPPSHSRPPSPPPFPPPFPVIPAPERESAPPRRQHSPPLLRRPRLDLGPKPNPVRSTRNPKHPSTPVSRSSRHTAPPTAAIWIPPFSPSFPPSPFLRHTRACRGYLDAASTNAASSPPAHASPPSPLPPSFPPPSGNRPHPPTNTRRHPSVAPDLIWGPNPTPFAAQHPRATPGPHSHHSQPLHGFGCGNYEAPTAETSAAERPAIRPNTDPAINPDPPA